MRKKIGILCAQIDEPTQKKFLKAFLKEAYAKNYDVCIFSMHQKYQETPLRDIGDSNIFELVNYEMLDAIVILLDTILTPNFSTTLQKKIKDNFDGPVLAVDKDSPFFDYVMMDHYTPMKELVDHLIEVHGYKDIAFLGGKEGHPHSLLRIKAFEDSMKEHKLVIKPEWVYNGNYWYDSAEKFADELLANRKKMPRAIACANDYMAIGLATRLAEKGVKIPEEVAIVGYDSVEDGRKSPRPITSADIPVEECGKYCLKWVDAAINGEEKPRKFVASKTDIFVGSSCGCECETKKEVQIVRPTWSTMQSSKGIFSDFNHILEDLLSQNDFTDFLKVIEAYSYQIKPFNSFHVCLNEGFLQPENNIGEQARHKGYSDKMYEVLRCGDGIPEEEQVCFARTFYAKDMCPMLSEERDYPTAYVFNPVYFDDRCFGYTVLNFGKETELYNMEYRVWMRNVMQGFEAFYRQQYMHKLVEQIKADQVRDTMTGLYNYQGFLNETKKIMDILAVSNAFLHVIALDIKGIMAVNEVYGREYGDKAIAGVARIVQETIAEDEVCARMCNDEFLIAYLGQKDSERGSKLIEQLQKKVSKYRLRPDSEFKFSVYTTDTCGAPFDTASLEELINQAISIKNHKKKLVYQEQQQIDDFKDEIKRNQLVNHILNDNLLTYYYQPIVRATDGSIYAYEALMRYEQDGKYIPAHDIIMAADYLNRLHDVERATFLNVTGYVSQNIDKFGNAKIFINSLPGYQMGKIDEAVLYERMSPLRGRFVIEFTEESELTDKQFDELKKKCLELDNDIALDDYGAGYSNVNNLLRYMPKYVKIDRLLVEDIDTNPQKEHFVKNIIEFAHKNKIMALAEGIKNRDELKKCIVLGVDLIQGFYTGKAAKEPIKTIDQSVSMEIRRYQSLKNDWRVDFRF